MKRQLIAAVGVAAMVVGIAACSSDGDKPKSGDSGKSSAKASDYSGKTLTVWFMSGSNPDGWTKDLTAAFEKQYPGAKLKVEVQQWNGIGQKVTTALSEENPPDVLEMGNTQTAGYAATGGLLDLTADKASLGGDDWAENLNKAAVYDGKQYAAPWYFTNRVVIYNKKLWAKAGIKDTPKSLDEFYADLEKLNKTPGVSQALYLPGQEWYTYFGLVISENGSIAQLQGDKWVGALSSPAAKAGFDTYAKLQSFSKAPKDKDEATPQQSDVFAKGDIGAMIGLGWEAGGAVAKNAALKDDIGYFALPGKQAGKPSGVFLGGSNLAISANSKNPELAKGFLKLALSDQFEGQMAKEAGIIPNRPSLNSQASDNPFAVAAIEASASGATTPSIPEWAAVENDPNPIKGFMTAVLQGKDYAATAKKYDDEINKRLSQKQ
ncbi:extracellular solute-binding protein [Peterkaempfera bronchialis]|uniref:Extracellular solute-binding protein n=1 Tax=Peterkaempfera bronchialis TaxID=2126346 RepID=A0A345T080_9ACTN|nr:extracellular solute-binding protein [Peterkaempfera bronchialis]AXI79385.1 extracellular solute-binding protein [Peterkaempfera bronchialis]